MIWRDELVDYLNSILKSNKYSDYCPNGLQVAGTSVIRNLVTAVSANQAAIQEAIACRADALLVHHGYFWKGEDPCLTHLKQARIKLLLQHDINLIAYHLPLDEHPELGNNMQLARVLGLNVQGQLHEVGQSVSTWYGYVQPVTGSLLAEHIERQLQRKPFYVEGSVPVIKTVAWCTGAAQDFIHVAIKHKCDAFITGEVSERTVDIARESGIHFYAAGHYATERYGVAALGAQVAQHFGLSHQFIEIYNPI